MKKKIKLRTQLLLGKSKEHYKIMELTFFFFFSFKIYKSKELNHLKDSKHISSHSFKQITSISKAFKVKAL